MFYILLNHVLYVIRVFKIMNFYLKFDILLEMDEIFIKNTCNKFIK